jgi:hypothetical protein
VQTSQISDVRLDESVQLDCTVAFASVAREPTGEWVTHRVFAGQPTLDVSVPELDDPLAMRH